MDGSPGITYRPLVGADIPAAYAVFRRSLFDYLLRIGMVDAATAADPPIESAWQSQGPWVEHLSRTAAENWVAEDGAGRVIGWAMSVERDGVLELTHLFVEPGVQAGGVGRALLDRAFPRARTASGDPRDRGPEGARALPPVRGRVRHDLGGSLPRPAGTRGRPSASLGDALRASLESHVRAPGARPGWRRCGGGDRAGRARPPTRRRHRVPARATAGLDRAPGRCPGRDRVRGPGGELRPDRGP